VPDEKLTVAVLANAGPDRPNADPKPPGRQLVEIFLADKLAPLPIVNTNISPKSYDALTGRYELTGAIMTISRRGPHLFVQVGRPSPEAEIFPESDTKFFSKTDTQITFVKDSSGKAVKLIFHTYGGIDLDSLRAKDIAGEGGSGGLRQPGRQILRLRQRRPSVLTVTREGNRLFAQLTGQPKFEIFPKSETEYFGKVVDAQVTFVKDATGKVTKAIHHQWRPDH
jgi:D-alanyl-D-alanine-carboxypeptidase/D-alanyl-D-alanine-endopeptidase